MVYVSFFEGFGIPVLEAMRCHVPVIASDATALPEICGNAALLVDPDIVSSIAAGMSNVAGNEAIRKSLVEKGKQRCEIFSWDKSAALLWQSVEKVMK
ncbi:MAG: glycosyltransferase [Bacteroidia bacterium]|nr:glycosyltransferase [Bacteroidia bacterium]